MTARITNNFLGAKMSHKKKMIAPIVVSVIFIIYYVLYFGVLAAIVGGALRWILGLLPIVLSGLTVMVCVERIKEIKKGEEDDLSKY